MQQSSHLEEQEGIPALTSAAVIESGETASVPVSTVRGVGGGGGCGYPVVSDTTRARGAGLISIPASSVSTRDLSRLVGAFRDSIRTRLVG